MRAAKSDGSDDGASLAPADVPVPLTAAPQPADTTAPRLGLILGRRDRLVIALGLLIADVATAVAIWLDGHVRAQ